MADREIVIKNLEICVSGYCKGCTYDKPGSLSDGCWTELMMDAFFMLKEQDELLRKKQCDINKLCNEISGWKHKFHDISMKEQEAEIERLKRPDCEHANHDGAGCLGYCGCEQDDEPIDACKQCEKYTGNICAEY